MGDDEEKKGFTIRDRRFASQPETPPEGEQKTMEDTPEPGPRHQPSPEINFSSFVLSLSTSTLLHLGEVPDPITRRTEKNLPLAKQSIDILGMLKEKTRGNLTSEEEKLIDNLLADLRWRYIRETKG